MESINIYFSDLKRKSIPLTREQEFEIGVRIQNGDETALNILVEANLLYVITEARKFRGHGVDLDDLIGHGNIALMKAAQMFDPHLGYKFITYAKMRIIQAFEYAIADNRGPVRVPVNQQMAARKGHTSGKYFAAAQAALAGGLSLNTPIGGEEGDRTIGEILSDPSQMIPDQLLEQKDTVAKVRKMISKLKPTEQKVIKYLFGINCKELDIEDIAQELNLTTTRIHQLKRNALLKLQELTKIIN